MSGLPDHDGSQRANMTTPISRACERLESIALALGPIDRDAIREMLADHARLAGEVERLTREIRWALLEYGDDAEAGHKQAEAEMIAASTAPPDVAVCMAKYRASLILANKTAAARMSVPDTARLREEIADYDERLVKACDLAEERGAEIERLRRDLASGSLTGPMVIDGLRFDLAAARAEAARLRDIAEAAK